MFKSFFSQTRFIFEIIHHLLDINSFICIPIALGVFDNLASKHTLLLCVWGALIYKPRPLIGLSLNRIAIFLQEYFDESVAVTKVKEWLESAPVHLENKDSLVDQIYCVAKVRKALSMCAHYINKLIGGANSNIEEMEETLLVANQLCDGRIHLW